jgi:hypothetical protein
MSAPADWEPLAELCRAVAADLPRLVDAITDQIRTDHPVYEPLSRAEHLRFIHEQARQVMEGLTAHRLPSEEQIERARELGRRRARQGLPVEVLIDSYHIGFRTLWNALLATTDDPALAARLVEVVDLMWTWLRLVCGATADAHSDTIRSQQAAQANLTHRLLRDLRGGDTRSDEVAGLARALGYDPEGRFQAFCLPCSPLGADLSRLARRFAMYPGVIQSAEQGDVAVILSQELPGEVIVDTIRRQHPDLPIGVGLCRRGLDGAAAGIVDAERAFALAAQVGGSVDFHDEWLIATLAAHRHELAPLLEAERTSPPAHLVEAVRAYAENGFSVTAAARTLHLHPNTVKYRLDRWEQLTGWTPRTLDGLMRSLLSLRLYPLAEDRTDGPA